MTDITGLSIKGDTKANNLAAKVVVEENGDHSIYNVIHGGLGDDTLSGIPLTSASLVAKYGVELYGDGGNDKITGSKGADTLSGGTGNDIIFYSGGADKIDGGLGFDSFSVNSNVYFTSHSLDGLSMNSIEELLVLDSVKVGDFDLDSFKSIRPDDYASAGYLNISFSERADITHVVFTGKNLWQLNATKYNDVFNLSASSTKFIVNAGNGNDLLIGGSDFNNLIGGSGNDTLKGGAADDYLQGGADNDRLYGGGGKDALAGSAGDDFISGDAGNDSISTGAGNDIVHGGDGNDIVSGIGGSATDFKTIDGGAGNDRFEDFKLSAQSRSRFLGGAGEDTLEAYGDISGLVVKDIEILHITGGRTITADADTLDSFDQIIGTPTLTITLSSGGTFTLHHGSKGVGQGTVVGSNQSDHIDMSTSAANWKINGGAGNDVIVGDHSNISSSQYVLSGGAGNDTITGGKYYDILHGDAGNDVLSGGAGYNILTGGAGSDRFFFQNVAGYGDITDFTAAGANHDTVDLSAVSAIKDFDSLMKSHVEQHDGYVTISYGKFNIYLDGVTKSDLHAADFIF